MILFFDPVTQTTLPVNHPNHSTFIPNPPQYTNFLKFGLILLKLGVEVKIGEQSLNPSVMGLGKFYHPLAHPTISAKFLPNF